VTVALFAIANLTFWFIYDRAIRPRSDLLRVESFAPAEGATVGPRPTLSWRFNLDLAHAGDDPVPGSISPQVKGRWSWPDARTVKFTPEVKLPKATRFTFTLSPQHLHSAQGFHLAQAFVSTVQTAPLSLASATQIGTADPERAILELRFSDNVLPADVLKALTIKGPDGKAVRFDPYGDASGDVVRVITDSIEALRTTQSSVAITVRLAEGLAGTSGPLGLAGAVEQSVPITTALAATELRADMLGRGGASLRLCFNNDIDLETIRPLLSVKPSVKFELQPEYHAFTLVGDFQPATRYAVTIAKSAAGADPQKYPRGDTLSVFIPDSPPTVWFEHPEGYLGSRGNRALLGHAVNVADVHVNLTRVYDNNLVTWRNANDKSSRSADTLADDYGKPIASKKIHVGGKKNQTQDLTISLDDLLPADANRDGAYRVELSTDDPTKAASIDEQAVDESEPDANGATAMVTLSDLGVCAKQGHDGIHAWVASLADARPVAGVRVRAFSDKNQLLGAATTDADGLVSIANINPAPGESPAVLIADRDTNDLTWLDLRTSELSFPDAETTGPPYLREGHEAFIFTERGVYRPGEMVHLRAIVRGADLKTPAPFPVRWKILRPDLRNWNSTVTKLDESGEASWDLQLPEDLTTGRWTARIGLPGDDNFFGSATFQVEEFLPDRLKAGVTLGKSSDSETHPRMQLNDEPLTARIQGDWLFGKPAAGLATHVVARLDPTTFAPAGFTGWTFGDSANTADVLGDEKPLGKRNEIDAGELDEKGSCIASLHLNAILAGTANDAQNPRASKHKHTTTAPTTSAANRRYPGPWRLSVAATVLEPGGRGVTATTETDIDRVSRYVGVQRPEFPLHPGQSTRIPASLIAPDGSLGTNTTNLTATLYRETWNNTLFFKDGRYHYDSSRKLDRVGKPTQVSIVEGKGEVPVAPPVSGAYVLRICDGDDGAVTSIGFFAAYGEWDDNISREDPEKLELSIVPAPRIDLAQWIHPITANSVATAFATPQMPTTQPIETKENKGFAVDSLAEVLVRSPFAGRLLLTVETDSILQSQVIDMPASHMLVPIVIPRNCRPNAYVSATVVRAIEPNATWRVHRAIGVTPLKINNDDRRLNIAVAAPAEVRPEQTLDIALRVVDSRGNPVANASIDVSAVDEGICQLTNFATPDPFGFFYAPRAWGVTAADLYGQLMPEVARPDKTSAVGGDGEATDSRHHTPISAKRVRPVAMVNNVIRTDENGDARTSFSLPQFVGQLRVMAVAHAQDKFGDADAHTLVRSPLLVQSSWPRFVAPGDAFTVTLTAFNNSSSSGEVNLSANAVDDAPLLRFVDSNQPPAQLGPIMIRAGGQSTQILNVIANRACGVAHVHLVATLDSERFEETVEIPVRPASPVITTGGYAVATPDHPAALSQPTGFLPGTDHFEVRVTPFPSLQLPQGLDYLERYPYGCAEQTTSTLFPLVYLSDIGQQIAPGVFAKERVDDKIHAGIIRLLGMQTADGGVAMWQGGRTPWPWASVYVAHFVVEAQNAGHDIPEDFRTHLMTYVRNLLNHSTDQSDELETQAYAAYVLALAGKPDRAAMDRIGEIVNKPQYDCPQARFHLAAAWVAAGRRDRAGNLLPTTIPPLRNTRQLAGNVGSAVRERAILLSTLLMVDPDRADLPALAQQLADAGKNGQWRSTQDTAFAVMALGRYLRQCKAAANYDTAQLIQGAARLASAGAGESLNWIAPTTQPASESPQLQITGPEEAKAYVAWLSNGVPTTAPADADNGLKIRRRFLDERGKPIEHNTVRSGDLVQVELSVESSTPLENIVVEDLLPAGLEIENPRLETSAKDTTEGAKQSAPSFNVGHIDMRDDRMIIMGELQPGAGQYVYTCRAVTPGKFTLPPARAECMYDLGTSSIWGAGSFTVIGAHDTPIADTGHE
jgi:uncharacterized protein YfaS (alpha-2-macroglobulin family)